MKSLLFVKGNLFILVEENEKTGELAIFEGLSAQGLRNHVKDKNKIKNLVNKSRVICKIVYEIDYSQTKVESMTYSREEDPKGILTVKRNPAYRMKKMLLKEYGKDFVPEPHIITDYKKMFGGKLDEFITLNGLILKHKEDKKNKVVLIAPTNTGKTALIQDIGAAITTENYFLSALANKTGLSVEQGDKLMKNGILLIDDFTQMPKAVHNIGLTAELKIMNSGGKNVPTSLLLWSTTSPHVVERLGSSEWGTRLLVFVIPSDGQDIIKSKILLKHGKEEYRRHTKFYVQTKLLEVLESDLSASELNKLEETYHLDHVSEIKTYQENTLNAVINKFHFTTFEQGEVGVKTKGALKNMIAEEHKKVMGFADLTDVDTSTQLNELLNKMIEEVQTRRKIEGSEETINCYLLKPKYKELHEKVVSGRLDNVKTEMKPLGEYEY